MDKEQLRQQVARETKIHKYYRLALKQLSEGISVEELEEDIQVWEEVEEYEACAGIQMAIKNTKYVTIEDLLYGYRTIKKDSQQED